MNDDKDFPLVQKENWQNKGQFVVFSNKLVKSIVFSCLENKVSAGYQFRETNGREGDYDAQGTRSLQIIIIYSLLWAKWATANPSKIFYFESIY